MFTITVLGSGTVIPSAGRGSTSVLLETGRERIMFDCGPSTPRAAVSNSFRLDSLDRIVISHFHPDHTLGLGHFIAAAKNDPGYPEGRIIPLYGPEGIKEFIESWGALYGSFTRYPVLFDPVSVHGGDMLSFADSTLSVLDARHGDISARSYRLEADSTVFVYTGDTAFSEQLAEFAYGADLIAAECSFPDHRPAPGHMTVSDVGRLASLAVPERVLLLHMYPSVDAGKAEDQLNRSSRARFTAGRDGMKLTISGNTGEGTWKGKGGGI